MFDFSRTKRVISALYIVSALSLVLTVICYMAGGHEVMLYGFMNEPLPSISMVVFAVLTVMSCLGALALSSLMKDTADGLNFIYKKARQSRSQESV